MKPSILLAWPHAKDHKNKLTSCFNQCQDMVRRYKRSRRGTISLWSGSKTITYPLSQEQEIKLFTFRLFRWLFGGLLTYRIAPWFQNLHQSSCSLRDPLSRYLNPTRNWTLYTSAKCSTEPISWPHECTLAIISFSSTGFLSLHSAYTYIIVRHSGISANIRGRSKQKKCLKNDIQ